MTTPRLGEGAYVGLGLVSGYDTNGTNTDIQAWFPLVSGADNVQAERPDIVLEDLFSRSDYTVDLFQGGHRMLSGTLTMEINLSLVPEVIRAITGHNPTPTGTDPYTYVFTLQARGSSSHYFLGSSERALCIEVFHGGSYANSLYYQGVIVTEATFVFEKNDFARVTMTVIGRTASLSTKSTPTMTDLDKLLVTPTGQGAAALQLNSSATIVHSATVTIRNGLATRHDLTGLDPLLPVPEGKESAELQVDIEVADDTFVTNNVIQKTPVASANQLTIQPNSGTNALTFLFYTLLVVGPGEPRPSGPGPVRWNGTLRGIASSPTTGPIQSITVINNRSGFILT